MSAVEPPAAQLQPAPSSPRDLLRVFSALALQGFGGVLPVAQRELVERQRWLTRDQFLEVMSVGQVLPGPNIVNLALIVGDRFFGWRGACAALTGILALPLTLVMTLAVLYTRFAAEPMVAGALHGMSAVAAGLIVAMALKLLPSLARNPLGRVLCGLVLIATVAAVGWLRWPIAYAVLGVGGLTVLAAWWRLRLP